MTVATIDAQFANMMLVTEGDRLLDNLFLSGCITGAVETAKPRAVAANMSGPPTSRILVIELTALGKI